MAIQSKSAPIGPWGKATAGATGAVLANALVYPLDIVKTRLQVQEKRKPAADAASSSSSSSSSTAATADVPHYASTWDALSQIVAAEGPLGLYAGMSGSLLGVASTNFAYFFWYNTVRDAYFRATKTTAVSSTAVELALGAVAGALAQLFTIPVAVVTTRQQTQTKAERKGMLATAREVIDGEDGITGLWRGLKASLVLVVNPSFTYGAYERLRPVLFPDAVLKPWQAFVLGALSKALATIATQPLIVAKVGLQSKPPPSRQGKPFKSFWEVLQFIYANEGLLGLFKGIGPQITKGVLVQGILMMTKERTELTFILFMRYLQKLRSQRLAAAAKLAASNNLKSPVLVK